MKNLLWLLLAINSGTLMSQFPHCPKFHVHEWKTEAEFNSARDSVKHISKWLNDTPLSWEYEQRTKANLYVLTWLTQHPTMKWQWSTRCFGPLEDHLDLMYAFLHASLYFSLTREKVSDDQREIFVMQSMAKKIEQSKKYDELSDWKDLVKAVRRNKEAEYLKNCKGLH